MESDVPHPIPLLRSGKRRPDRSKSSAGLALAGACGHLFLCAPLPVARADAFRAFSGEYLRAMVWSRKPRRSGRMHDCPPLRRLPLQPGDVEAAKWRHWREWPERSADDRSLLVFL